MYNPTYYQQLNKVTADQKVAVLVKQADAGNEFAAEALSENLKKENRNGKK